MKLKTNDKPIATALKNQYEEAKREITLSAILNSVYAKKIADETIRTKVSNQLNAIETSIDRINPKFKEKSKNYDKVKQEMLALLNGYEANLVQLSQMCNKEIQEAILEKVELESKLLMAWIRKEYLYQKDQKEASPKTQNVILHGINRVMEKLKKKAKEKKQLDVNLINRIQDGKQVEKEIKENLQFSKEYKEHQIYIRKLQKEIKLLTKKINDLNEQKTSRILDAMETGDKMLSTQIRRPHTIKRITKFFTNRFNTYHVIQKNVLEPMHQRIDEFKVNELKKVEIKNEEFNLQEIEKKIYEKQNSVLNYIYHKIICKEIGIL